MERIPFKLKLLGTAVAAWLISGMMISWGCPEMFIGMGELKIFGVWFSMTVLFTATMWAVVFAWRVVTGLYRAKVEREIREEVQLYGREWMYIRPAVRANKQNKSFVRL